MTKNLNNQSFCFSNEASGCRRRVLGLGSGKYAKPNPRFAVLPVLLEGMY